MTVDREGEASKKKEYALPEGVLNDYMRRDPKSGWTRYLQDECPTIMVLADTFERALSRNTGKHGDVHTWKRVINKELFKNKFLRHVKASRVTVKQMVNGVEPKEEHKDSAIANAVFLVYFDILTTTAS